MSLKIRYKLFLAILVANLLLAGSIYLLGNWAFAHSFREYLDQTEARKLEPMAQELAEIYRLKRSWRWLRNRDNPTWPRLVRKYGRENPPPRILREAAEQSYGTNPPPAEPGSERQRQFDTALSLRTGMLLQNSNRKLVIGRPADQARAYWIPITLEGKNVGYLGFVRRLNITSELDLLFAERIKNNMAWIVLGILLISALISIPLASFMVRPIEKLRLRANELASGNYQTSTAITGKDEIGRLAQDINVLAETLNKNLNARQQWIADISHELRTPVAVLQGEIEALQDGVRPLRTTSINSLHQEIVRLSKLVNDLHELSMSDIGALSTHKEKINIVALVSAVVEQFRSSLQDHSTIIKMNSSTEKIFIDGDYQRLEQLFVNLAVNSQHYTQSPGSIIVTISAQSQQVVISWSDSEPGVPDEAISHLFERLYRVETSRNRNAGGSGLGLAICQNIVEAHHGSIRAEHSKLGGVSIVITLPLSGN